jgi:predicted NBD/HSP70 family sugar kinase
LHALLAQGGALNPPADRASSPLGRGEFWRRAAIDSETGRQGLLDLQEEGLVEQDWSLSAQIGVVLCLSLGTESARGALVDPNGNLTSGFECPPLRGQLVKLSRTLLLNRLAKLAHAVLTDGIAKSSGGHLPLIGVSVAWPVALDAVTKEPPRGAFPHAEWDRDPLPVTVAVARRLRLNAWAGSSDSALWRSHGINDANAVAVSAAFNKLRERALQIDDGRSGALLAIRAGGAIGGGVVLLSHHQDSTSAFLDSYLIEGRGFAGEIAHLPIGSADVLELGPALGELPPAEPLGGCSCGRETCLDAVASARAVVSRVRRSGLLKEELDSTRRDTDAMRLILDRSSEVDEIYEVLRQAGRFIGRSMAGPIMTLNPRQITLTGSLAHAALMRGIEDRQGDWKHVRDEDPPEMKLLQGWENSLSAAQGAGLVVLRSRIYRRFEDLDGIRAASKPYTAAHLQELALTLSHKREDRPILILRRSG